MFGGFSLSTASKSRGTGAIAPPPGSLRQQSQGQGQQRRVERERDYFEDDDEEDGPSLSLHSKHEEEEEDDPLDSFMACIEQQVSEQDKRTASSSSSSTSRALPEIVSHRDDYDDEHEHGRGRKRDGEDDEHGNNNNDEDEQREGKARVEPLPPMDHSLVEYRPFKRNLYREHAEIAQLSEEEVEQRRRALDVSVSLSHTSSHSTQTVPRPIASFAQCGFPSLLDREIAKQGLVSPTPIQAQTLPVALSGRDCLALAQTGSGKTLSFLWPCLCHCLAQPQMEIGDGPIALVLCPTRELVQQIWRESQKYCKPFNLRVVAIYGGAGKWEMHKALKDETPEMVIATPGRFIEMVREKATNLRRCSLVVLDEADRMFEMGFEYQMRSILQHVRPDRQLLMFSATMKKKIEHFARDMMRDEVRVSVGLIGHAAPDIAQTVVVLSPALPPSATHEEKDREREREKWRWLSSHIDAFAAEGKVLVFVLQKNSAELLCNDLRRLFASRQLDISVDTLHGDKDQRERESVMQRFARSAASTAKETLQVLVATDLAARGLDVHDVHTVVNYETPKNIETYVHRIGRTGRMGVQGVVPGTAYTLLTSRDSSFAVDLVQNLRLSAQPVSEELLRLASSDAKWHRIKHFSDSSSHTQSRGSGGAKAGLGVGQRAVTSEMLASSSAGRSAHRGFERSSSDRPTPSVQVVSSSQHQSASHSHSSAAGSVLRGFVRSSSSYSSVSESALPAQHNAVQSSPSEASVPPSAEESSQSQQQRRKRTRWDA